MARAAALAPPWPLPGKGLPLQLPQAPVGTRPQMQQRLHSTWATAHLELRQGLCHRAAAGQATLQLVLWHAGQKPQGLSLAAAAKLQVSWPCLHRLNCRGCHAVRETQAGSACAGPPFFFTRYWMLASQCYSFWEQHMFPPHATLPCVWCCT